MKPALFRVGSGDQEKLGFYFKNQMTPTEIDTCNPYHDNITQVISLCTCRRKKLGFFLAVMQLKLFI